MQHLDLYRYSAYSGRYSNCGAWSQDEGTGLAARNHRHHTLLSARGNNPWSTELLGWTYTEDDYFFTVAHLLHHA